MEYIVVPIEWISEIIKVLNNSIRIQYDLEGSVIKAFINPASCQAAIAAAPDTGMIAVDKVKFEAFKTGVVKALTAFKFARFDTQDEWRIADTELGNLIQALKDMGG